MTRAPVSSLLRQRSKRVKMDRDVSKGISEDDCVYTYTIMEKTNMNKFEQFWNDVMQAIGYGILSVVLLGIGMGIFMLLPLPWWVTLLLIGM